LKRLSSKKERETSVGEISNNLILLQALDKPQTKARATFFPQAPQQDFQASTTALASGQFNL
jgi:hypothetical protein